MCSVTLSVVLSKWAVGCSGVDSRKLGATSCYMGSVIGHVMANANIGRLVTRAPARRCPGTRTKAKTLLINSCYTLVVMFRVEYVSFSARSHVTTKAGAIDAESPRQKKVTLQ